jgi:hypothetical protein
MNSLRVKKWKEDEQPSILMSDVVDVQVRLKGGQIDAIM